MSVARRTAEMPTLVEVLAQHEVQDMALSTVLCRCDTDRRYNEHAAHQSAAWDEARTVRTAAELDALPLDTVVVDAAGIPRTKRAGNSHMSGGWTHAGNSPLRSRELADGRAMWVVWHPSWKRPVG